MKEHGTEKDCIELKRIAVIHTDFPEKFGIPRQSGIADTLGTIVFEPDIRIPEAFRGIEEYTHLWLIWGFSENFGKEWSPTVRPPRLGGNIRKGVFATRAPIRPNPIGLSLVELMGVRQTAKEGIVLDVKGADLMDGTPIYDIKPYLAFSESRPDARGGFADRVKGDWITVAFNEGIEEMIPTEDRDVVRKLLSQDPRPSYQDDPERDYGMAYKNMNIKFRAEGKVLTVTDVVRNTKM